MDAETFQHDFVRSLREHAISHPETTEGASCVNRAFKVRKKNFVFLGEKDETYRIMVKLGPSLEQANDLAKERPDIYTIGGINWVTMNFPTDETPPDGVIESWITESYRLLAPKTLVKQLDDA